MKELDKLVSINIFDDAVNIKDYSTDIGTAFELLDLSVPYRLGVTTVGDLAVPMFFCEIFDGNEFIREVANTQAIAICKATLKVKGVDYEG